MPQICIKLSPNAQTIDLETIRQLDRKLQDLVASELKVAEQEVVCSAINLVYSRGEADIQIEFHYNPGKYRNWVATPLNPSIEKRMKLIDGTLKIAGEIFRGSRLTCSAWTEGYADTKY
jgi:hypothetical protein